MALCRNRELCSRLVSGDFREVIFLQAYGSMFTMPGARRQLGLILQSKEPGASEFALFLKPIQGMPDMKFFLTLLAATLLFTTAWAAQPVNVNTASAEEIAENLKGIGLSKAQLIVDYRETNGSFDHVDELVNVKGIGVKTVDRNRGMIILQDEAVTAKN
jgi:competence protein ComEA